MIFIFPSNWPLERCCEWESIVIYFLINDSHYYLYYPSMCITKSDINRVSKDYWHPNKLWHWRRGGRMEHFLNLIQNHIQASFFAYFAFLQNTQISCKRKAAYVFLRRIFTLQLKKCAHCPILLQRRGHHKQ